jgi:hypothetical protein
VFVVGIPVWDLLLAWVLCDERVQRGTDAERNGCREESGRVRFGQIAENLCIRRTVICA